MRKLSKTLILSMPLLLLAFGILAPAEYGIALNHELKQCAGYWAGDEFVTYELPDGWESYHFQYSLDYISVSTDIGTCKVFKDDVVDFAYEEPCCEQLGYTFVSKNIGIRTYTSFNLTHGAEILTFEASRGNYIHPVTNPPSLESSTSRSIFSYVVFITLGCIIFISIITIIRRLK